MKKPVLVILAAGIGSRYGGMKQIDGVGNHGEPIIEFSIYDAYRAGFEKVVLIIKKEHEAVFRSCLTDRVERHMEVGFAYQDMNDLPEGITVPADRTKPWGTTHALWACRDIVDGPFAIINADDFYGRNAYKTIYDYLCNEIEDDKYAMVGWQCRNTLADHGTVTRGVCQTSPEGYLTDIVEIKEIAKKDGKCIAVQLEDGVHEQMQPATSAVTAVRHAGHLLLGRQQELAELAILRRLDAPHMACHHYHAAAWPEGLLVPGEVKPTGAGRTEKVENLLLHAVS